MERGRQGRPGKKEGDGVWFPSSKHRGRVTMVLALALMGQASESPQQPQATKAAVKTSSYGSVPYVHPPPMVCAIMN